MPRLLAQILFAWLQSFSPLVSAVCIDATRAAAVGVGIVCAAPIRATVVWRVLLLALLLFGLALLFMVFSSQPSRFVQNGPRMWRPLDGEESARISSRNLPGVMLSCDEGDVAPAAEALEKSHIRGRF